MHKLKNKIMSHNIARIPSTDEDKNSYYINAVPYINEPANQLRFKTNAIILGTLNSNFALWGPNWKNCSDKFLVNKIATDLKEKLEAKLDSNIAEILGEIPDSVLTDDDRKKFLIFERKAASAAVVSSISPEIRIDSIGHLWAIVLFHNTATPTSKEAPVGNFVFFETFIGEAGIADSELVFGNGNVSFSAFHTFSFTIDQVGKTCYVRCAYQIKKGNRSPESSIISFVIR